MSVILAQRSSTSAVTLSAQRVSGTRTRVLGLAPSMYGGAGGSGTRISQSTSAFLSESPMPYRETVLVSNEKLTMQNLNDRLASYLDKVRTLEKANSKLELQIREFQEKKTSTVSKDFNSYFSIISKLQDQIRARTLENHRLTVENDNARIAAEDFQMKYETELNMRMLLESDVSQYRGVRDALTLSISDLEVQTENLKEELVLLKNSHKEEMHELRTQQTGTVKVEVDSTESADLMKVLQEVREQYEALVQKNKLELDKWFKSKVDSLQTQITTQTTEVKTHHTQLSELKKTYQSLEINRQSVLTEIQCLQENVDEASGRYSVQLSNLQMTINKLETELQQLRTSMEQQQAEYNLLLDIKMRLELEIAEYRRLLEMEYEEKKIVVVEEEVEDPKHHVEKRTRIITENLVDGVVVSRDVKVEVEECE